LQEREREERLPNKQQQQFIEAISLDSSLLPNVPEHCGKSPLLVRLPLYIKNRRAWQVPPL